MTRTGGAATAEHRFPWEFYEALAPAAGWGSPFPSSTAVAGKGITEAAIVLHEIAASGAAMNGCSAVHLTMFGLNPVVKFGNDRLRETFLPRAARGELHVAFGVTEPDAGTDTSRITCRAIADGDGWRIRGRKIWTSKALESEVVLLLARTSEAPPDRSFRRVEPVPRRPRSRTRQIAPIDKMGRNAVASCEVVYDDLPGRARGGWWARRAPGSSRSSTG